MLSYENSTASRTRLPLRPHGLTAAFGAVLLTLLAALLLLGAGKAQAASSIEGIWSFNGGEIAIQGQPDGTFTGTVVATTKFDKCDHVQGEQIWKGLTLQPDGSYYGTHQWFEEQNGDPCYKIPVGGLSAFRIIPTSNGGEFLKVCLSRPGGFQPSIAANGTATSYDICHNSDPIAPLPTISPAGAAVTNSVAALPSPEQCVVPGKLRIKLRNPEHDPLEQITVSLRSGRVKRLATIERKPTGALATLDLTGLTAPTFTVRVQLTTVLGSHLRGKRRYNICSVPKRTTRPKVHQ